MPTPTISYNTYDLEPASRGFGKRKRMERKASGGWRVEVWLAEEMMVWTRTGSRNSIAWWLRMGIMRKPGYRIYPVSSEFQHPFCSVCQSLIYIAGHLILSGNFPTKSFTHVFTVILRLIVPKPSSSSVHLPPAPISLGKSPPSTFQSKTSLQQ